VSQIVANGDSVHLNVGHDVDDVGLNVSHSKHAIFYIESTIFGPSDSQGPML
jgi:hypothetical protein